MAATAAGRTRKEAAVGDHLTNLVLALCASAATDRVVAALIRSWAKRSATRLEHLAAPLNYVRIVAPVKHIRIVTDGPLDLGMVLLPIRKPVLRRVSLFRSPVEADLFTDAGRSNQLYGLDDQGQCGEGEGNADCDYAVDPSASTPV